MYIAPAFMLSLKSQEVVGGFNRREAGAFALIREKFYARTFALVNQLTGYSPDSEELVAEVFIKLYNSDQRFENIKKIKDFIYITAQRMALNLHKKQEKRESKTEDIVRHITSLQTDSREADEALASFKEHVYKIVKDFPRQMKNIFVHYFKDDLSNAEIAVKLGLTEKTVANQKAIAISKLKFEFTKRSGRNLFLLNLFL
jgi:RNA polymerase sigma factor (sigma-70 family)